MILHNFRSKVYFNISVLIITECTCTCSSFLISVTLLQPKSSMSGVSVPQEIQDTIDALKKKKFQWAVFEFKVSIL